MIARAERFDLFCQARELQPGPERAAFLDAACACDDVLRAELDALLDADTRNPDFMKGPALPAAPIAEQLDSQSPDAAIGPYRLLNKIGEGGMGTVYRAEQQAPVRRTVALKLIRPGMNSALVLARFQAEQQALAIMDHPGIARVFDAGTAADGRPYFVMEFVDGLPIVKFCDEHRLPLRERLALFAAVCRAIHHAHQKGIIHRDIKPSNILVSMSDERPVPKVIDFGIAKAIDQDLADTQHTHAGSIVGTLEYMSPEQAGAQRDSVDTRSDVYALGVLLYEMISGSTPLDRQRVRNSTLLKMLEAIRDETPLPPSTRITQAGTDASKMAQRCQAGPRKLALQVRGELDWIALRALEKDRARRYQSALELGRDVERYLQNEPVEASPPTRVYRFRKLVSRNKTLVAAIAAVTMSLIAGLAVSTRLYFEERSARETAILAERAAKKDRDAAQAAQTEQNRLRIQAEASEHAAKTEAARSKQVATVLRDMLSGANPDVAQGRDTKLLRDILDKTAARIDRDLKDQPEVEANLRVTIGTTYRVIGDLTKSEAMYRRALDLLRRAPPENRAELPETLRQFAQILEQQGHAAESERTRREALKIAQRDPAKNYSTITMLLDVLANNASNRGDDAAAAAMYREEFELIRAYGPNDLARMALSAVRLHTSYAKIGDPKKDEIAAEVERIKQDVLKKDSSASAYAMREIGYFEWTRGNPIEADALITKSLALMRKEIGSMHRHTVSIMGLLSQIRLSLGDVKGALALRREAWASSAKMLGETHSESVNMARNLSALLEKSSETELADGHPAVAEERLRECVAVLTKSMPAEVQASNARRLLGTCLLAEKKYAESESELLGYLRAMDKQPIAARQKNVASRQAAAKALIDLYEQSGQTEKAVEWKAAAN